MFPNLGPLAKEKSHIPPKKRKCDFLGVTLVSLTKAGSDPEKVTRNLRPRGQNSVQRIENAMLQTRWLDKFNDALPTHIKERFRETAMEEMETHPWIREQLGERSREKGRQDSPPNHLLDAETDTTVNKTSGLSGGIMELVRNYPGGLIVLLQGLRENGVADIVNSWISMDNNLPISPERVQRVFGQETVEQLAAKVGISASAAKSKLAELLPILLPSRKDSGAQHRSVGRPSGSG